MPWRAGRPSASNLNSVLVAINEYGAKAGLDEPHRLARFLAQLLHESTSFQHDKKLWGPTAAPKRYDVRTDVGKRRRVMVTDAPNFERNPGGLVNTDPSEGLGLISYRDLDNPDGRSLIRVKGDAIERLTASDNRQPP